MQSDKTALWAAAGGALALVFFPVLLFAGISGNAAATRACAPAWAAAGAQSGADSSAAGPHINLPLAQADAPPPVPRGSLTPGPWTYPVPAPATITTHFGEHGPHWSHGHTGDDFAKPAGTPVYAATDGVVLAVTPASADSAFGTFVTMLHADNVVTMYAHLTHATVTRGQQLASGDQLGTVGSTGNTTGPHLHFEVRPQINGHHLPVNPGPYLEHAVVPAASPADPATTTAVNCLMAGGGALLPDLAQQMTPTIRRLLATTCPELPLAWVDAQVMAESSWDPTAWTADSNGGAAGLYQLSRTAWQSVDDNTSSWTPGAKPPPSHPVWEPVIHLRVGITYTCRHLRRMTIHLDHHPEKTISPLDAMAVCHIAGCSRVAHSTTGVPTPGEAHCNKHCVATIHAYLRRIHRYLPAAPTDDG